MGKLFLILLIGFLATFTAFIAPVFSSSQAADREARAIVHRFFTLVHQKKYEEAYTQFSSAIKKEVSFSRFKQGARDVKYLKISKIETIDREKNLIKLKISAIVRLIYEGNLYEAVYEGQVALYHENNRWKVMTVDLEAKSQKSLDKKVEPDQLQKLDFGT